ncbi:MAG: DUF167 domain-containing protein [Deltaproteobacteria bacterium]
MEEKKQDTPSYPFIVISPKGLFIRIKVCPGARHNSVSGIINGYLKVSIKARAVEGAANKALVEFLANALVAKKSSLSISSGFSSRNKAVKVSGMDEARLILALKKIL